MKAVAIALFVFVATASAGVIGASVDIQADYPSIGTLFVDGGTKTVDGSVEWPIGSFAGYNSSINIQITDTQLILSLNGTSTFFLTAAFNGFDVNFLTGSITGAVPDAASDFNPVISIVGQHLYLNYEDQNVNAGELSILDLTGTGDTISTAPEPASIALIACGLALLVSFRRVTISSSWRTARGSR